MVDSSREEIKRQLQQMDPYEFEKLVAELWELQGYETTVRKGSGDRGIDVEATKDTPFEQKVLIQAKRYAEGNKVGSEAVRNYATLHQQVSDADSVVLVTSSKFTSEAMKLADDLNVKIMDVDALAEQTHSNINKIETFETDEKIITLADSQEDVPTLSRDIKLLLKEGLELAINNGGELIIKLKGEVKIDGEKKGTMCEIRVIYDDGGILQFKPQLRSDILSKIRKWDGVDSVSNDSDYTVIRTQKNNVKDTNQEAELIWDLNMALIFVNERKRDYGIHQIKFKEY